MSRKSDVQELEPPPLKRYKRNHEEPISKTELVSGEEHDNYEKNRASDDNYEFVTPEEVEKLREFTVLDEVKSNDEDSNGECGDSESDTGSVELPEDEIEKMLEEDLPDGFKVAPKPKEKAYVTREKIVLEEKGVNQFDVLPLDWIVIKHYSGMPVYVHRTTRVCTLSRPYFLGKGNAKRHDIPITAIPCLAYRRALEEEEKQQKIDQKVEEQIKQGMWNTDSQKPGADTSNRAASNHSDKNENGTDNIKVCPFSNKMMSDVIEAANVTNNSDSTKDETFKWNSENSGDVKTSQVTMDPNKHEDGSMKDFDGNVDKEADNTSDVEIPLNRQPVVLPGGMVMPSPRVETANSSWKSQHLTHEQVNEYCQSLFKFKVLTIMHFKRWADRRKYTKARKALQYPTLPEGTKLITIPIKTTTGPDSAGGKTMKRDWVMNMNGRSYLSVFHEYVRRALQKQPVYEFKQLENASTPYQATVYIGDMQYGVGYGSSKRQAKSAAARASIHILIPEMREHLEPDNEAQPDFMFFDYVGIEDPRIAEFCAATCEPTPHVILRTCLLRNFGAGDRHIHTEMKKLEYQKIELTMKVGKHSATVVCKNKKTAKQRASQAILQALHPHVRSWGSLLRLYGSRSVKSCKEKKLEEQQITLLQDKARHNEPNYAVLEKLRNEMKKLHERDAAVVPIGTLLLTDDLPTHSSSNLNNVEL